MNNNKSVILTQPDDWHIHLRDHQALSVTVPAVSRYFARAIVMPNTILPIVNLEAATHYFQRINQYIPAGSYFSPLMTLYLTQETTTKDIKEAAESDIVYAAKLYPANATTNSAKGVKDIAAMQDVFAAMQEHHLPLLIHGEVTDHNVDVFDRERIFIERHLSTLVQKFPELRIVLEHITTSDAVDFVTHAPDNVAATITAHHLLYHRNALFHGGIRPHMFCLPVLKREQHQQAILKAATSGNPKFFLGTDSAPHAKHTKESACGCAGIYTSYAALELYAEAFAQMDALHQLEGFASFYGADFYGLPRNTRKIVLEQKPWMVPEQIPYIDDDVLVPLKAGEEMQWLVTEFK